jgi:sporulation protein YlmC with PRC-barrel domain
MYFLKKITISALVVSLLLAASAALAQAPVVGATQEQIVTVSKGWSVTKDIMNKDVFTDDNEKFGTIEDIIVTSNEALPFVIISTGGFLGMAKHNIVVPFNQFKVVDSRIVLPGATKEIVKAMPEFKYTK